MANTTKIILKNSGTSGNIPSSANLDHGEIAINYADGVLYYKNSNDIVLSISGTSSAFNVANTALIVGTAAFDRANLANGTANTALIAISAAFDRANLANGTANTALIIGSAAFDRANLANGTANTALIVGSAAFDRANLANGAANTSLVIGSAAFDRANLANGTANTALIVGSAAFDRANLANSTANTALINASAAFDRANLANSTANTALINASAAFDRANLANSTANTALINASAAFDRANLANSTANTALINASAAFDRANLANSTANTALINASAAFDRANIANNVPIQKSGSLIGTRNRLNFLDGTGATITITDDAAGDRINVSIAATGTGGDPAPAFDQANNAFNRANLANGTANTALINASAAFNKANQQTNLAFSFVVANGVTLAADSNADTLTILTNGNVSITADAAGDNLTFDLTNTGVTPTTYGSSTIVPVITIDSKGRIVSASNVTISGGGTAAFDQANSAYDRANTANNLPIQKSGTLIGTRNKLNFIEGTNVTINVQDDSSGDRVNVTISSTGGGGGGSSGNAIAYISDTEPPVSANGFLWWNSLDGTLYIKYGDGDTVQWVVTNPYVLANANAPSYSSNVAAAAYNQANNAFDRANLANSTANTAFINASAAFDRANLANGTANTALIIGSAAFDIANLANSTANTALIIGSAAFDIANLANGTANTAYSSAVLKTGNTMTGNLVMSGANITFVTTTVAFTNSGIYWANSPTVGIESGIYSNGTNTIVFSTANQEKIRLDSGNLVFTNSGINMNDNILQRPIIRDYALSRVDLGNSTGTMTINLELGNFFTATSTGLTTWVFSNPPTGTTAGGFILELTNGGSQTQNWPSVKWPGGVAPTLTTSGVDILVFISDDGGTTWRGVASMIDSK